MFLSAFGNDDSGYYHHQQDLFYHSYNEQETNTSIQHTGSVAAVQQRPFSASSSSCSSDSEHTQQNFHLQTLGNPYYDTIHGHHGHHFSNNGFFSNQSHVVPVPAHQNVYGHELHGHQSPGSTGVIQCPYV